MYVADSRHAPVSDADAASASGSTPGPVLVPDLGNAPAPVSAPMPVSVPASGPGRAKPGAVLARLLGQVSGTVLALGTVSLVTDISSEMVTAVLPLYMITVLRLSPLGFGVLDGVYNGVTVVVRLLGGVLADHGGASGPNGVRHKAVAAVGYSLSALCKPLLLVARAAPMLGLVLAVDRTGKGLRTAPRDALISLATPPERRARAFGVHRAMDTGGALAGPLLAFLILRTAPGGYHAVFTVSACVAALGVVVLVVCVPRDPLKPMRAEPSVPPTAQQHSLLKAHVSPGLRRVTVCASLLGLATLSDSFVYLLLQRRLHLSAGWFPLLPLGTAGVYLLLAVPLGALGDRFGPRRAFVVGHLALLAGYGVLLIGPGGGLAVAAVVLTMHGLFYAATDGMLSAATAATVPSTHHGTALALVGTGQAGNRFVCSLAMGALWAMWGSGLALALMAGALAAAIGIAACVLGGVEKSGGAA